MAEFSFIIPVFNGERTLAATLESIRGQSHRPIDIIVVDNGSTDGTRKIASRFPGVTYAHLKKKGRSRARNKGAALAKGDYLAFVDADVVLAPDWLEKAARYLGDLPLDAVATRIERLPDGDTVLDSYREALARHKTAGTFLSTLSPRGPVPTVNTAACIYSRESLAEVGGFDNALTRHEDFEISLRMFSKGYLIGGIGAAKAAVRFATNRTFPKARVLAYLWRAFELQRTALSPNAKREGINWPLLNFLRKEESSPDLLAYAALIELARILGRQSILTRPSKSRVAVSIGHGRNALTFSFSRMNTVYCLRKPVNFIFIDRAVYAVARNGRGGGFKKLNRFAASSVRKLRSGRKLSLPDVNALLKTGCFAALTTNLSGPLAGERP